MPSDKKKCVKGCGRDALVSVPGWNRPSPDEDMCIDHADEMQKYVQDRFSRLYWAFTRKMGSKD